VLSLKASLSIVKLYLEIVPNIQKSFVMVSTNS